MVKWPKVGVREHGCLSWTVLSYISSQSLVLTRPKGSSSTFSKQCASPRGSLCDSISREWECWMTMSQTSLHWRPAPKGKIPFGKTDLATIVLASGPMLWQNQYKLNHSMVPKSTCTLLPDFEAIEQVMVETWLGNPLRIPRNSLINSLTAIGAREHQLFIELRARVVSQRIYIRC